MKRSDRAAKRPKINCRQSFYIINYLIWFIDSLSSLNMQQSYQHYKTWLVERVLFKKQFWNLQDERFTHLRHFQIFVKNGLMATENRNFIDLWKTSWPSKINFPIRPVTEFSHCQDRIPKKEIHFPTVKNYHFLDKIITDFYRKLLMNWCQKHLQFQFISTIEET